MIKILHFVKDKFWFFLSFTFCKAIVFLAPLLIAEILSKENFGILEYALAGLGMVLNTSLNLGVPGAYPFFKLRQNDESILSGFNIHYLWLLLFFLVNQVFFYTYGFPIQYYMAINIAYIVSNQVFISTKLKTNENITKAVFFDSGIYLVLLIFIILNSLNLIDNSLDNINLYVQIYSILYALYALSKLFTLKLAFFKKYIRIIKFSHHLLFSAVLIFFITVSGRFLIEYFLRDFKLVGIYSFYFRIAALVVMIHQIVSIVFFKKIYTLNPKILDKYFALFFIGLYVVSNISFSLSYYVAPSFSSFFKDTINEYGNVYFILSAQVLFWISSALTSNIIDREELAKKINPWFFGLIVVFLIIFHIAKSYLTLEIYTLLHFLMIYLATLMQYLVLNRKKIFFKKSIIVLTFIFFFTIITYLVKYL